MHSTDDKLSAFRRIIEVLDTLRERCPWDAKQTNESLRPNTVEEVFELADALIADDTQNIKRKSWATCCSTCSSIQRLLPRREQFDIADVCNSLADKLIFRHPHIYGNVEVDSADKVAKTGRR